MHTKKKERFLRTYFLIFNLILATIAIAYLIGSVDAQCAGGTCPLQGGGGGGNPIGINNNPSSTPNPGSLDFGGWGGGTPLNLDGSGGQFSSPQGGSDPGDSGGGYGDIPGGMGEGGGAGGNPVSPGGRVPGGGGEGLPNGGGGGYGDIPGGVPGATPPTYPGAPQGASPGVGGGIGNYFDNLLPNLLQIGSIAALGGTIGGFAGGKNGAMWGTIAGAAGALTYQIVKAMGGSGLMAGLAGLAVFALIFILTYVKESKQIVEFQCLPWQSPTGGDDCERCNEFGGECGEYTCKSLGQACDLVNKGEKNQMCVWKNPHDVNSPIIEMVKVSKDHKFVPDKTIRPPATGVEILLNGGKCIKAFTPLEFTFVTKDSDTKVGEPSQCKIDYNLTTDVKTAYDSMGYYVGGDSSYSYNHTEKLSLPGPAAIDKALENVSGLKIKNDGVYTLYIRCMDANGNFNRDVFSVRFCVEPGPDTTPPMIMNVSIPSGSPVQFNRTDVSVEFYINEPADCKWGKEDIDYKYMEGNMTCDNNLWDARDDGTYACRAKLQGIENRKENLFYIRCLDKPDFEESERNPNTQSYLYRVYGTQPLNILRIEPNSSIAGATDLVNVTLYARTDNGHKNGEAICFYSTTGAESDYVAFSQTGGYEHWQIQNLVPGSYRYFIKCVDLGGNAAYNDTSFRIENDKISPGAIRIYKESGQIKIITNEEAECSFSHINCNFDIDDGIKMSTADYINHNTDWEISKNFFIRCKDKYNNQPNPNVCTIIIRPIDIVITQVQNFTIEL